ncbi:hypothetical protein [Beihai picorna-like virus 65]|uniref:hypothetical protein n=1 Tax=Beihai picorna-like virus 65 TaxID=1922611 RepID=UPI00090B63A9|nr:hypothetical protein [Beihai picorna-like virus 65]APG78960.1 hypothetical protein [Beihai picorna-like virus 65]
MVNTRDSINNCGVSMLNHVKQSKKWRKLEIPVVFNDHVEKSVEYEETFAFVNKEFPVLGNYNRKQLRQMKKESQNLRWIKEEEVKEKLEVKQAEKQVDRTEKKSKLQKKTKESPYGFQWKKSKPMKFKKLKKEVEEMKPTRLEDIESKEEEEVFISRFISEKFEKKLEGYRLIEKQRVKALFKQAIKDLKQKVLPYEVGKEEKLLYKKEKPLKRRKKSQEKEGGKIFDQERVNKDQLEIEDFEKFVKAFEDLKTKKTTLASEFCSLANTYGIDNLFRLKEDLRKKFLETKDLDKFAHDLGIIEFMFQIFQEIYGVNYGTNYLIKYGKQKAIMIRSGVLQIEGIRVDIVRKLQANKLSLALKTAISDMPENKALLEFLKRCVDTDYQQELQEDAAKRRELHFEVDYFRSILRAYNDRQWVTAMNVYENSKSIIDKLCNRKDLTPRHRVMVKVMTEILLESAHLLLETWGPDFRVVDAITKPDLMVPEDRPYFEDMINQKKTMSKMKTDYLELDRSNNALEDENNNAFDDENNNGLINMIKNFGKIVSDQAKSLYEYVKSWWDKILSCVSGGLSSLTDAIAEKVLKMIIKMIDPMDLLKNKTVDEFKQMIPVIILIIFLVMQGLGFVSFTIMKMVINKFCGGKEDKFKAQSVDQVSMVTNLFNLVFPDLSKKNHERIRNIVLASWGIVAISTLAGNLGKVLLFLIPTALKEALILRFGTKEQISKYHVDEWISKATIILRSSKITAVLLDKKFKLKLAEVCEQGLSLTKNCARKHKTLVTSMFMKLVQLQSLIEQSSVAVGQRDCPWYLHLSADPGVGKNLIIDDLIESVTGIKDPYYRPVEGDYWSGYINQKAIVIDEFLVGKEDLEAKAKELLALVSVGQFLPELASVDNPTVGIKGTVCAPKAVITLNNTPWNSVDGIPDQALQRRRNVNVRMLLKKDAKMKDGNSVDISRYTKEEIANVEWATFIFLDPIFNPHSVASKRVRYDFKSMVELLKEDYEEHNKNCKKINEAFGRDVENSNRTSTQMVEEIIAEIEGVTENKDQNIFGSFFSKVFGESDFYSQGKKRQQKRNDGFENYLDAIDSLAREEEECKQRPSEETIPKEILKVDSVEVQKEKMYCLEHKGCNPNRIHRHKCSSFNCNRQVAHKHPEEKHEYVYCKECSMFKDFSKIDTQEFEPKMFVYERKETETHDMFIERLKGVMVEVKDKCLEEIQAVYLERLAGTNLSPDVAFKTDLIIQFLGGCSMAYMLWRTISWIRKMLLPNETKEEEEFFLSQSPGAGDKHIQKKSKVNRGGWKRGKGYGSQSGMKNTMFCFDQKNWMYCVPIDKDHILTFDHFEYDGQKTLFIKRGQQMDQCKVHSESFLRNEELDICIIKVGGGLPTYRNKFINNDDIIDDMYLTVKMLREDGWSMVRAQVMGNVHYDHPGKKIYLERGLIYNMKTLIGDCGAPLVVESPPSLNGKIIGIHVAGNENCTKGLATIVTKEDLDEAMQENFEIASDEKFSSQGRIYNKDYETFEMLDPPKLPNIKEIKQVHIGQAKGINGRSSIKPSLVSKYVDWKPKKFPPVMSMKDPRNKENLDPYFNIILRAGENVQKKIDEDILEICEKEFFEELENKLIWKFPRRRLTFEEAIKGIEGLNPLDLSTSAGFPLCNLPGKGKKCAIWTNEKGEYEWTDYFKETVENFVKSLSEGDVWDHRFLGFLKDEIVKPSKIEVAKTRGIYCGDMIATVGFRMVYGSLIAACNCSGETTPFCMGLNQYSYDFDIFTDYLKEVGNLKQIIAGDYTGFDMHFQRIFQEASYRIFSKLAVWTSEVEDSGFFKHQVESPVQLGLYLVSFNAYHFSGCVLTAIINCIQNVLYFMYCYYKLGNRGAFFRNVRVKVLGDDHLINVAKTVNMFDGKLLQAALETFLGQEYTSEDKETPVVVHKDIEQCTFLGAHPVLDKNGRYFGRLKKDTIKEAVLWTRDDNLSIVQVVETMIEHASLWEKEFFDEFQKQVVSALRKEGIRFQPLVQEPTAFVVKQRTTRENILEFSNCNNNSLPPDGGLTNFHVEKVDMEEENDISYRTTQSFDMSKGSQEYGAKSMVRRNTLEWLETQTAFSILQQIDLPFGLLSQEAESNIQNMLLSRWLYSRFDLQLVFQINGSPFQQGLMCVFFNPLSQSSPSFRNWRGFKHVFLNPNRSNTVSMIIPYRHFKSALNMSQWSKTGAQDNFIGQLNYGVLSPLLDPNGQGSTVTTYASMINEEFYVPRPSTVTVGEVDDYEELEYSEMSGLNLNNNGNSTGICDQNKNNNGNHSSKSVVNKYNLDISGVMGNMPIQGTDMGATSLTNSIPVTPTVAVNGGSVSKPPNSSTDGKNQGIFSKLKQRGIEAIGNKIGNKLGFKMDNPPLTGGGVPTYGQFSSLSKSSGVEPTVGLSLNPQTMYRKHHSMFNERELEIDYILSRRGVLDVISWDTKNSVDHKLKTIPLDSLFGLYPVDTAKGRQVELPFNIAMLNEFYFWRGIICLEIRAVRTTYHSGRLRYSIGYGTQSLLSVDRGQVKNGILDFNGEIDVHEIEIPWNTVYEFLRTYEGKRRAENYSLGCLDITVANKLRCPSTVNSTIQLILSLSLKESKVAVPRSISYVTYKTQLGEMGSGYKFTVTKELDEVEDIIQNLNNNANDEIMRQVDEEKAKQDTTDAPTIAATDTSTQSHTGCSRIHVGAKFESSVDSVLDVVRRHCLFDRQEYIQNYSLKHQMICNYDELENSVAFDYLNKVLTIGNRPYHKFYAFYRAWAGTLKYRLYCQSGNSIVTFLPTDYDIEDKIEFDTVGNLGGVLGSTTSKFVNEANNKWEIKSTYVPSTKMINTSNCAREVFFQSTNQFGYIDVSVPYQNHRDFSPTLSTSIQQSASGSLSIATGKTSSKDMTTIYQAAGDDFMFGIFAPPDYCYYTPSSDTTSPWPTLKIGCFSGYKFA